MSNLGRTTAPFRYDIVGSFLRPASLKIARERFTNGLIDAGELRKIEDEEIARLVEKQKAAGLRAVTDGEFRRGSYWGRFVERTEGLEVREALLKFRDDQGHEVDFTAPYAVAPIRRTRPLAVDEFAFL